MHIDTPPCLCATAGVRGNPVHSGPLTAVHGVGRDRPARTSFRRSIGRQGLKQGRDLAWEPCYNGDER